MLPLLLLVCFLAFPIIEIYVIIQVGQVIGALPTVALLLVESALGAWIVKREGRRAWVALQDTFRTGRLPDRELANAALILIGGTLLLTPGFVTDALGFAVVLPFTRPAVRRLLATIASRRLEARVHTSTMSGGQPGTGGRQGGRSEQSGPEQRPSGGPRVVRGDVIDDD